MKTIKKTYEINSRVDLVWQALVNPTKITGWGAGPAEMSDKAGYKFKLWGGDIYGKNTKVKANRLLAQEWYGGEWPEASNVTIKLSEKNSVTKIELVHTNVPDTEYDSISEGWDSYYFGPMKEYLEHN